MWGDNILSPVQIICKDKILQIAPHAATGLILTELKEVHTYLPDEIGTSPLTVPNEILSTKTQ